MGTVAHEVARQVLWIAGLPEHWGTGCVAGGLLASSLGTAPALLALLAGHLLCSAVCIPHRRSSLLAC
jgi:hypothetical protein